MTTLEVEYLDHLEALPDSIGDLTDLNRLNAAMLNCPLPETLDRLPNLTDLEFSHWRRFDDPQPFPDVLTRLTGLVRLDIRSTQFTSLPKSLAGLTRLEELVLDAAISHIPDLTALTGLPSLIRLNIDGRRTSGGDYPSFDLLEPVWGMSNLVELAVDRFGRETAYDHEVGASVEVRPAITRLPDAIFDRLTKLRRLDLSFIDLTTLPESLYRLPSLEFVNLEYTKLDKSTVERLGRELAHVRLNLRHVATRFDVEDANWQQVHSLVKAGADHLVSNDRLAVEKLEAALRRCTDTAVYSSYDELYARYGLINALGRLANQTTGDERSTIVERCRHHARQVLAIVPPPGAIWHFTDEGAFQQETTRQAANALGWYAMEAGRYDEALRELEPGLAVANLHEHGFIYDTKVRVLLRQGDRDAAYLIVDQILTKDPEFGDFQDLRFDGDYLEWKAAN